MSTLMRFTSSEFTSFSCILVCIISFPSVVSSIVENDKLIRSHYKLCNRVYLPLYQYIVPRSCGPCCNLQTNVISLPDFTYKSGGPISRAFNSETRREERNFKHR